MILVSME